MKKIVLLSLIIFLFEQGKAQSQSNLTQTIRGSVVDNVSKTPLPGANVVLLNSNSPMGTKTDHNGNFRLSNVPVGRKGIQVSFVGFKTITIQNLIVNSAKDQRNDIIIRGNSPSGLLWRLEDTDIPNPNHFAEGGTTGGPVGMLNNNLLVNSDFFTSAFPAEYGNALSGVFDLKMRNGNTDRHEFLFQSGFNGFELGAEGPFNKKHQSSYLANYRYSTLQLVDNIIDFGTSGVPKYQDFSYKLNFPLKKWITF